MSRLKKNNRIFINVFILFVVLAFSGIAMPSIVLCDIVINEIRIDQPGTDIDEYFELAGPPGTSLDGLTYLVIGDGPGASGTIEAVVDLSYQTIPSSGYFVVAESTFTLGAPDLLTSLNFENNDNVTHMLVSGFTGASNDDLDIDDDGVLDVTPWTELIDLVALIEQINPPISTEYHYGPPSVGPDGSYVPGHVILCEGGWEIGAFSLLESVDTPGSENDCFAVNPGDVIINEIMQNPSAVSDSAGEWFELFNPTSSDIDIDGWTILDNDFDNHVIDNGGPLIIPAGGFLVLGRNNDPGANGGVIVDYAYGDGWYLANATDEIVLLANRGIEIDRVEYDGGPVFPDPNGASMALIDSVLDNNFGVNWCTSSTPFGDGDFGTPGEANDCLDINEPPDCSQAVPSIEYIWPPNHKFVPVTILGVTDPDGDPVNITIDSIFQDEPVNTHGDGSSVPDGRGIGTNTVEVRAERSGTKKLLGNGRVYHIGFFADDGMGGSCLGEVLVGVPHDKSDGNIPIDDGPLYDSTIP